MVSIEDWNQNSHKTYAFTKKENAVKAKKKLEGAIIKQMANRMEVSQAHIKEHCVETFMDSVFILETHSVNFTLVVSDATLDEFDPDKALRP